VQYKNKPTSEQLFGKFIVERAIGNMREFIGQSCKDIYACKVTSHYSFMSTIFYAIYHLVKVMSLLVLLALTFDGSCATDFNIILGLSLLALAPWVLW
jgi:hypothetical protein